MHAEEKVQSPETLPEKPPNSTNETMPTKKLAEERIMGINLAREVQSEKTVKFPGDVVETIEERPTARPSTCHDLAQGEPIVVEGVRANFIQPWHDFVAVVRYPNGQFLRKPISKIRRDVTRWVSSQAMTLRSNRED